MRSAVEVDGQHDAFDNPGPYVQLRTALRTASATQVGQVHKASMPAARPQEHSEVGDDLPGPLDRGHRAGTVVEKSPTGWPREFRARNAPPLESHGTRGRAAAAPPEPAAVSKNSRDDTGYPGC